VVLHLNPSSSTVVTHSAFTLFAELAMRSGVRARLHTRWTSCTRITRRLRATSGHRTRVSFTVCINSIGLFALRVLHFSFLNAGCPYGIRCQYIHGRDDDIANAVRMLRAKTIRALETSSDADSIITSDVFADSGSASNSSVELVSSSRSLSLCETPDLFVRDSHPVLLIEAPNSNSSPALSPAAPAAPAPSPTPGTDWEWSLLVAKVTLCALGSDQ
jgi:hypothetical protein